MPFPPTAELCDVGPRDGFQFESVPIPTDLKLRVIAGLVEAGVRRIQATSFVHPKWVPQMADAEDLAARLPEDDGVIYTGLVLNERGLDRALQTKLTHVDASIATNERHSRDNANMSVEEAVRQGEAIVRAAREAGREVQMGFQTVWGYAAPGDTPLDQITDLAACFADLGVESLSLADSTGLASPLTIERTVRAVQEAAPDVPLVVHLHDTRGLGLANVVAALRCGVRRFDTSLGGLGGCPFIPGATGNVATEDVAYLLARLGVKTGVDRERVAEESLRMEAHLGRELPGKGHALLRAERTAG